VGQGRAAQRQADQGSRLSEPQASSSETPRDASSAGNHEAQRSGPDFGSPFGVRVTSLCEVSEPPLRDLCLLSSGEAKKRRSPAAATERLREDEASTALERTRLRYLSPNGYGRKLRYLNPNGSGRLLDRLSPNGEGEASIPQPERPGIGRLRYARPERVGERLEYASPTLS
jgi:hypothetical protein